MANRMVLNVADGFHVVDALMLFRENVAPQWEDPMNADGGHFQFQFKVRCVCGSSLGVVLQNSRRFVMGRSTSQCGHILCCGAKLLPERAEAAAKHCIRGRLVSLGDQSSWNSIEQRPEGDGQEVGVKGRVSLRCSPS